jgi:type VI secretion system protein ImpH
MAFAPSTVSSVKPREGSPLYDLNIYSFGLFGPNGPLPLHLTEYVRERVHHHHDRALLEFCNLFHHRLTLLLYRAWANAQPTASLDRRDDRRFDQYLSSLIGLGCEPPPQRDSVAPHARYYMTGHLTRQARNHEGLQKILANYFRIPVRIIQNVPVWLQVEASQRTRLKAGRREPRLGMSTLLGIAVRDVQHKFRIELGPMPLDIYNRFLPDGDLLTKLRDWVRLYVGIEFIWDLRLILEQGHTAHARIGSPQKLGLNTWLRAPRSEQHVESHQLVLTPEPLDRVFLHQPVGSRPLN